MARGIYPRVGLCFAETRTEVRAPTHLFQPQPIAPGSLVFSAHFRDSFRPGRLCRSPAFPCLLRWKLVDEPIFHFLARPGGLAQKRKTGFHGRIELETSDRNAAAHFTPAMTLDQLVEDAFQRNAV